MVDLHTASARHFCRDSTCQSSKPKHTVAVTAHAHQTPIHIAMLALAIMKYRACVTYVGRVGAVITIHPVFNSTGVGMHIATSWDILCMLDVLMNMCNSVLHFRFVKAQRNPFLMLDILDVAQKTRRAKLFQPTQLIYIRKGQKTRWELNKLTPSPPSSKGFFCETFDNPVSIGRYCT